MFSHLSDHVSDHVFGPVQELLSKEDLYQSMIKVSAHRHLENFLQTSLRSVMSIINLWERTH